MTETKTCMNCKYVRRACNSTVVACGLLSGMRHGIIEIPDIKVETDWGDRVKLDLDFETFFQEHVSFKNESEVYNGWASLRCMPDSAVADVSTRDCIVVSRDNFCNYYERR